MSYLSGPTLCDRHQVVDHPVSTLLEGLKKLQIFANGLETVGVKCYFFWGWVGWVGWVWWPSLNLHTCSMLRQCDSVHWSCRHARCYATHWMGGVGGMGGMGGVGVIAFIELAHMLDAKSCNDLCSATATMVRNLAWKSCDQNAAENTVRWKSPWKKQPHFRGLQYHQAIKDDDST